jgi:nitrate reductase gamma subunit
MWSILSILAGVVAGTLAVAALSALVVRRTGSRKTRNTNRWFDGRM